MIEKRIRPAFSRSKTSRFWSTRYEVRELQDELAVVIHVIGASLPRLDDDLGVRAYGKLAYSDLACFRRGMSESALCQSAKKFS
jgi:hypothetical protein